MTAYQQGPEAAGHQPAPPQAGQPHPGPAQRQGPMPGQRPGPPRGAMPPQAFPRPYEYGPETKPAYRTTELIAYVATVLGVLIAAAVVDENDDGQGFGAERAWLYVTLLTIGYLISRGLAKSGTHHDPHH